MARAVILAPWLRWVLVLGLIAGAGVRTWRTWVDYEILGPGPLAVSRQVFVPDGDTGAKAAVLAHDGAIGGQWMFRLMAFLTRDEGALRSGVLTLPPHVSLRDLLTMLRFGTIPAREI
jgi:cell division protein YceG involved in septum cleavage